MAVGLAEDGSTWSVELDGAGIEMQSGILHFFTSVSSLTKSVLGCLRSCR